MKLLLDTHAVIWWFAGDDRLPPSARSAIYAAAPQVYVSAVSIYEIGLKHRYGKLGQLENLVADFSGWIDRQTFQELPLNVSHAARAAAFEHAHRDPFDRMLIAQAQAEGLSLVSNERTFDAFGVNRLW